MEFVGGGGFCQWVFIPPVGSGTVSNCAVGTDLETLGSDLSAQNPNNIYYIYAGPNDCMTHYGTSGISGAAQALNGTLNAVYAGTPSNIQVLGMMDDEGWALNCTIPSESYVSYDETFYTDYYADGGSTPTLGVGGGPPLYASDQTTLSGDGHGAGLAEIYAPNDQYNWPTSLAYGYRGIQVDPGGGSGYYSTICASNNAWQAYTGAYPPFDYDWASAGSSC